jgi:hypothetical protein
MSKTGLTYPAQEQQIAASAHDQVQIALAIADETLLKSVLVNCTPPIAPAHRIGSVTSTIGVPITAKQAVDGVLTFEAIHCILSDSPVERDRSSSRSDPQSSQQQEYARLTRCESETHILGQTMPQTQALSLLTSAGFSPQQAGEILHLPYEAWHKSWWYMPDAEGNFTVPFLRLIRTLRYTDGTFTVQYKDYYGQAKPARFKSQDQKVVIEIRTEMQSFRKTLEKINYSREQLGVDRAILICDRLSDLEARGFISQDISLYTSSELLLPAQADCVICANETCPLSNNSSPVVLCRQFYLQAE